MKNKVQVKIQINSVLDTIRNVNSDLIFISVMNLHAVWIYVDD